MTVSLEAVTRTDPRYQQVRDHHYVANRGAHGQQIHCLVWDGDLLAGIISGGSCVYAVKARDEFFGITAENRPLWLAAIVNNTVFRLEETRKNLGTETLAVWTRAMREWWAFLYEVPVMGFETFVVEEPYRRGSMYLAANWSCVGVTSGNTKIHAGKGQGLTVSHERAATTPKLIFCRWATKQHKPTQEYQSSWRGGAKAEALGRRREALVGARYTREGAVWARQATLSGI